MNVSRICMDGSMHPEEPLNQSQIFITTAGWKSTYAYDKLIQFLVWMVTEPEKAFILGGTWRIPVLAGLQPRSFLADQQKDGTCNEASFDREYKIFVFVKYCELLGYPQSCLNYSISLK